MDQCLVNNFSPWLISDDYSVRTLDGFLAYYSVRTLLGFRYYSAGLLAYYSVRTRGLTSVMTPMGFLPTIL